MADKTYKMTLTTLVKFDKGDHKYEERLLDPEFPQSEWLPCAIEMLKKAPVVTLEMEIV